MLIFLERIIEAVVIASAMGSVLTIIILAIKKLIGSKFNAHWSYCIWMVLLIRLLIPFAPESPTSVFNFLPTAKLDSSIIRFENSNEDKNTAIDNEVSNGIRAEQGLSGLPIPGINAPDSMRPADKLSPLAIAWGSGVFALFIFTVIVNIKVAFRLKGKPFCTDARVIKIWEECRRKININSAIPIICDNAIKRPMLMTFFKPKLLLPQSMIGEMSDNELKHIILHELCHIKRRDICIQWLMVAVQIVHWFNPLIWYAMHRMKLDCEIACDATVMRFLDKGERNAYGMTIIRSVELFSKQPVIPGTTAFIKRKSGVRRRIFMISKFKRHSLVWSVIAGVFMVSLVLLGLTNPITSSVSAADAANTEQVETQESAPPASSEAETEGNPSALISGHTVSLSERDLLDDVKKRLLDDYEEISYKDWEAASNEVLVIPGYLPERFKYYDGVFIKDDPGIPTQKIMAQLWYDVNELEILLVTQEKNIGPDSTDMFVLSDRNLNGDLISDSYTWANYVSFYLMVKDNISIHGYMLVNSKDNEAECAKILTSMRPKRVYSEFE